MLLKFVHKRQNEKIHWKQANEELNEIMERIVLPAKIRIKAWLRFSGRSPV